MIASSVMRTEVVSVLPTSDITEIANVMYRYRISAVPVVDENDVLVGIISEGDLIHRQELGTERKRSWWLSLFSSSNQQAHDYLKSHATSAQDIMTREVITVEETTPLQKIAELFERHHIKRVPVVKANKLVGIVSRANLIQSLAIVGSTRQQGPIDTNEQEIRTAITRAIREDVGFTASHINVIVDNDIVHLWGLVNTTDERDAIRVVAENTPGVVGVQNRIQLYSSMPTSV